MSSTSCFCPVSSVSTPLVVMHCCLATYLVRVEASSDDTHSFQISSDPVSCCNKVCIGTTTAISGLERFSHARYAPQDTIVNAIHYICRYLSPSRFKTERSKYNSCARFQSCTHHAHPTITLTSRSPLHHPHITAPSTSHDSSSSIRLGKNPSPHISQNHDTPDKTATPRQTDERQQETDRSLTQGGVEVQSLAALEWAWHHEHLVKCLPFLLPMKVGSHGRISLVFGSRVAM